VSIKRERHILNPKRHGMAGEWHGNGMGTACYVWIGLQRYGMQNAASQTSAYEGWYTL